MKILRLSEPAFEQLLADRRLRETAIDAARQVLVFGQPARLVAQNLNVSPQRVAAAVAAVANTVPSGKLPPTTLVDVSLTLPLGLAIPLHALFGAHATQQADRAASFSAAMLALTAAERAIQDGADEQARPE